MNNNDKELRKYDQLIVGGKGSLGDCFRACIATVIQCEPENLPNPHKKGVWLLAWEDYLKTVGLAITFKTGAWASDGYWIASVPSINYGNGTTHSVVMRGWELYHDPSPLKKRTAVDTDEINISYHIELADMSTVQAFCEQRGRERERLARVDFLKEETDNIEEAIALWRKNERKHHTWLLAWFEDNKRKLSELQSQQPGGEGE